MSFFFLKKTNGKYLQIVYKFLNKKQVIFYNSIPL